MALYEKEAWVIARYHHILYVLILAREDASLVDFIRLKLEWMREKKW